jgi:hypothetical protein
MPNYSRITAVILTPLIFRYHLPFKTSSYFGLMALTIFLRLFMTEAMLVSPLSLSTDRSWNINGIVARDYFLILAKLIASSGWRPGCMLGIEYLQSGSTLAEILSSVSNWSNIKQMCFVPGIKVHNLLTNSNEPSISKYTEENATAKKWGT